MSGDTKEELCEQSDVNCMNKEVMCAPSVQQRNDNWLILWYIHMSLFSQADEAVVNKGLERNEKERNALRDKPGNVSPQMILHVSPTASCQKNLHRLEHFSLRTRFGFLDKLTWFSRTGVNRE